MILHPHKQAPQPCTADYPGKPVRPPGQDTKPAHGQSQRLTEPHNLSQPRAVFLDHASENNLNDTNADTN